MPHALFFVLLAGVDLNLGCPQRSADRGGFGVFLAKRQPDLAIAMVKAAAAASSMPVSAKIRVSDDGAEGTVAFVKSLSAVGAWMVTVHGRTSGQRHHQGIVRIDVIAAVVKAVSELPIIGNGGVTTREGADAMLEQTGCAAVMSAGGLLANLRLFQAGPAQCPVDPFEQCDL
jgi:tRNA-dihydrouridine synthase